jgi:hypothetical protein
MVVDEPYSPGNILSTTNRMRHCRFNADLQIVRRGAPRWVSARWLALSDQHPQSVALRRFACQRACATTRQRMDTNHQRDGDRWSRVINADMSVE